MGLGNARIHTPAEAEAAVVCVRLLDMARTTKRSGASIPRFINNSSMGTCIAGRKKAV